MGEINKLQSSYQKDVNRLRKICSSLDKSNKLRKYEITQFNNFIRQLIKDNKITKEDVKSFLKKKDEVKNILNIK